MRPGAVMQCHSCLQKYQIKPHHIARTFTPPKPGPDHPLLPWVLEPFMSLALGLASSTSSSVDGDATWAGEPALSEPDPAAQTANSEGTAAGVEAVPAAEVPEAVT